VRLLFLWELHFFGLTPNDKEYLLEQIYVLIKHLRFTYYAAYNIPVWQRNWFIKRLQKEIKEKEEYYKNQTQNK
jgi:hypothetical protein